MSRTGNRVLFYILALVIAAVARADSQDFTYCMTCHGTEGNGNIAIRAPKIAGMEPWYLKRQLEAFRNATRGAHPDDYAGQEMQPVGVRLANDVDLSAAINFVTRLRPQTPAATVIGDAQRGRALYAPCGTCHGPRGEGSEALGAPALAGRSDWYLVTQLKNYRSGVRGSNPRDTFGAQMRAAASALPDDAAINDVIAYVDTLQ